MATQPGFFRRSETLPVAADTPSTVRAQYDPNRLRALPNDDLYLYQKSVDNSRLIRQADPASGGACWSAISAAALVLVVVGSVAAPTVYTRLSGYEIESLKLKNHALLEQKRSLEVTEAALLSPERLNELARSRSLTQPGSEQVIHLDANAADTHFAKNTGSIRRGQGN